MRRFVVAAVITAAAAGSGGCPSFRHVRLDPPPRASTGDGAVRIEVREAALARQVHLNWPDEWPQIAAVVDVRNDSRSAVALDLATSALEVEASRPEQPITAPAVAAGAGALPADASETATPPAPVTLAPGEARTLWILFARYHRSNERRLTLRLATTGREPLRLPLADETPPGPRWTSEPITIAGFSTRIETQLFGTKGYGGDAEVAAWVARGPVRLDLGAWVGVEYARGLTGLQQASTSGFGPTIAWHPWRPIPGLFASGALGFAHFRSDSGLPDRHWSPSTTIGLEEISGGGTGPGLFYRVGWVHLFDSRAVGRDAFMLTAGGNARLW
jgi:hypothetical protein